MKLGFLVILFWSLSIWAANGTNAIGVTGKSRAMGGTGVAHYMGAADALYRNPALVTAPSASEGTLYSDLAGTFVKIPAKADGGSGEKESDFGGSVVPDVASTYRLDELGFGLGVLGFAGAAFDFSAHTSIVNLKSDMDLIRILGTLSYAPIPNLSFGISPMLVIGAFSLNEGATGTVSTRDKDRSVGFAAQIGASYSPIENLVFGATYITETSLRYEALVNLELFGPNATTDTTVDDLNLEQPAELGIGVAYNITPEWVVTFDYRYIFWSDADLFQEFGWVDQNVFAIGTEYQLNKLALRAGFNFAKAPIEDVSGESGLTQVNIQGHPVFAQSISQLNANGFPVVTESHFTLGAGYQITEGFAADAAFVYAPEVTVTRSGTGAAAYSFTGKTTFWSISLGVSLVL